MLFQLGLILLWISAINCGGACDLCTCSKDPTYNGVYVWCGSKHLKSVPKDIPHDTTSLVLWSNDIANVNSKDVDYLGGLKWLDLTSNNLHSLPPNVFDKLTVVKLLSIRQNHLTSLPRDLFKHNLQLTDLYIDQNPLTCSCDLFRTLVDVIPKLNKDGMEYLGSCDGNVDLRTMTRDNEEKFCGKVTTPKPTTTAIPPTSHTTPGPRKDACSTCWCDKDPTYGGTYVWCGGRSLKRVPGNLPHDTTSLALWSNEIRNVIPEDFGGVTGLKYLDLTWNNLTSVTPHAFDKIDQLKFLSLRDNLLRSIPLNVFKNQQQLIDLFLPQNPLTCSCDLFHTLVDVIPRLDKDGSKYLGTCDGSVDLRTMTHDNEDKFCGKRRH